MPIDKLRFRSEASASGCSTIFFSGGSACCARIAQRGEEAGGGLGGSGNGF
jgi:hypothetical protein